MASVYNKRGILYISWWDSSENKSKNRSFRIKDTTANKRLTQQFSKKFQNELDIQKQRTEDSVEVVRVTLEEAFSHFKKNNESKNIKTIKDYDRFFKKFTEFFAIDMFCRDITKLKIEEWLNEIKKLSLSQNSKYDYYKQLNHFLNFLFEYNYTNMFVINKDVKPKPEIKEKIVFTESDIELIFKNLGGKNDNFILAIYLLFYTGLRSSDVLTIQSEKIDIKERVLRYYSPKRKIYREVPFHANLSPILVKAIQRVSAGQILNYKNVENLNRAITTYFKVLKIKDKKYSARTFRKTFITLCRTKYDMDATVVKELVGHEHRNTTDRYYNYISFEKMKMEFDKFKGPVLNGHYTILQKLWLLFHKL